MIVKTETRKIKDMKKYIFITLACLFFASCGSNNKESNNSDNTSSDKVESKQFNISVLLDLSNRIDTTANPAIPQHYVRDLEIIKSITSFFVNDMKKRGTFNSKGKMQVIFSPMPNDPNVNIYAEKLNVDCSKMNNTQKKEVYDNVSNEFNDNLSKIYKQTMIDKNWCGSDIWRFFKDDIDLCIDKDDSYRNILVIITDGYIYHENTVQNVEDRFTYISPSILDQYKLRNNVKWEEEIKSNDFGLLAKRNDLKNLEILVLEVNSYSEKYKSDEDVIKYILNKWFTEMGVERNAIYYSSLPTVNIQKRIVEFLSE